MYESEKKAKERERKRQRAVRLISCKSEYISQVKYSSSWSRRMSTFSKNLRRTTVKNNRKQYFIERDVYEFRSLLYLSILKNDIN